MDKRTTAIPWVMILKGSGISLAVYLCAQALLAVLAVKAVLPEASCYYGQLAAGVLATLIGSTYAARRCLPLGTLCSGLASSGLLAVVLILMGLAAYGGISVTPASGGILAAVLGGGVLAGLLASRKKSGGRKAGSGMKRSRPVGKRKTAMGKMNKF